MHRASEGTGHPEDVEVFDGLVAAAGGYVEVEGEVLADRRFSSELAARTITLLDANEAVYILEDRTPRTSVRA